MSVFGSQLLTNSEVIAKVIELGLMVIMGHAKVELAHLKTSSCCLITKMLTSIILTAGMIQLGALACARSRVSDRSQQAVKTTLQIHIPYKRYK